MFAYEDALEQVDRSLVYFGDDFSLQTGAKAADYFVNLTHMPDAIYAGNDMVTIGLLNRFKELGVRVPEVAKVATELLLQRIHEQKKGFYERVQFEPRLIVRESSLARTRTTRQID